MELASLIPIIIAIGVAFFLIKFVVSPIIRAIIGVVSFVVILYFLQRFTGFDLNKISGLFGINLDMNKLNSSFSWVLGPAGYYIDRAKSFFDFIWSNFPK